MGNAHPNADPPPIGDPPELPPPMEEDGVVVFRAVAPPDNHDPPALADDPPFVPFQDDFVPDAPLAAQAPFPPDFARLRREEMRAITWIPRNPTRVERQRFRLEHERFFHPDQDRIGIFNRSQRDRTPSPANTFQRARTPRRQVRTNRDPDNRADACATRFCEWMFERNIALPTDFRIIIAYNEYLQLNSIPHQDHKRGRAADWLVQPAWTLRNNNHRFDAMVERRIKPGWTPARFHYEYQPSRLSLNRPGSFYDQIHDVMRVCMRRHKYIRGGRVLPETHHDWTAYAWLKAYRRHEGFEEDFPHNVENDILLDPNERDWDYIELDRDLMDLDRISANVVELAVSEAIQMGVSSDTPAVSTGI